MKYKLLLAAVGTILILLLLASAVWAEEEPPPPYAGQKNPFPWSDASAQQAGKGLYQQSCLGCHGIKGENQAMSNFSAADFPQRMEEKPDFYFWVLSEGRMNQGMPGYKSSLSAEQRWQVLTYLWSLGAAPTAVAVVSAPPAAGEVSGTLLLTAPQQSQSGQPLTLQAILQDDQGKPITSATVQFFLRVEFFARGLMEIGQAVTNGQGVALLEYSPRQTGTIEAVARYGASETTATVSLTGEAPSYQAEAGIRLPAPGEEVFIGPASALELEMGKAPATALRLPGGILSWLLLMVGTVALIWFTYFRILYQVFRIPIVSEIRDVDTRLIPLAGMAFVTLLGIMLALMLLTGPYSHLHLLR